jgi:hypothetical protein
MTLTSLATKNNRRFANRWRLEKQPTDLAAARQTTIVFVCHDGEITVENRIVPYDPLSGLSEST